MKTVKTPLIITGFRAKVDGSLGISATTPELSVEEKVAFMELQNQQLTAFFEPEDDCKEVKEVKGKMEGKSSGQRLRAVIFVYFSKKFANKSDFNSFYEQSMEKLIEQYKNKINEL